jgi:hypothetical protein
VPLGGNNRLAKDSVAKLWLEGRRRDEIDLVTDELSELPLQADELKEADRPAELDEEIDVAVLAAFVAGERTEKGQTGDNRRRPARDGFRAVPSGCRRVGFSS